MTDFSAAQQQEHHEAAHGVQGYQADGCRFGFCHHKNSITRANRSDPWEHTRGAPRGRHGLRTAPS